MHKLSFAALAAFVALVPLAGAAHAGPHARATVVADTPRGQGDIVAVAAEAGQFSTLLAAAQAAGLVETLRGPGPFTVFAPTDAAFAGLGQGTVEDLLKPENRTRLQSILTYHVVPGRIFAADLLGRTARPRTVQGETLRVDGRQGGVAVNTARVVAPDVVASNGVIHVIDRVLLPSH